MAMLLVVDDEEILRICVTAILSAMGHSVIQARDGLEAYELYQKLRGEISLVLMDVVMPRLNGIDAALMIKEIDPNAKVVLMSGYTDTLPGDIHYDGFIGKPFRARDLHAVVQKVLGEESPAPWEAVNQFQSE
jgi:two-component system, cell cycle sensor histidine kinase and response regulator CckA